MARDYNWPMWLKIISGLHGWRLFIGLRGEQITTSTTTTTAIRSFKIIDINWSTR